MKVFQGEEVAVSKLREKIEVVDVPLARECIHVLEFGRPDCALRERVRMRGQIDRRKEKRGRSLAIAKTAGGELLPVPGRVIGFIAKHVAAVVQDDVQDHAHSTVVRLPHQVLQVLLRAEARVDLQEVLGAVAVVGGVEGHLFQDRADPERRHAEVLEIIEPGGEPGEVADAVPVRIHVRAHAQLVDDRVLVPLRVVAKLAAAHLPRFALHGALLP